MANLIFQGGYFRYEIQQIEEEEAKNYRENGIDESDLDDLDFSDECEQGISGEVAIFLDEAKVSEFDLAEIQDVSMENTPSYWHIIRLENGRRGTSYSIEILSNFDESKIYGYAYAKNVGGEEYRFYQPGYDEESAEQIEERIDQVEFFIVSPTGEAVPLEIN